MYPDIPKFEISFVPDVGGAVIDLLYDPGGVSRPSSYATPAAGVTCQTEWLALAAAQFSADCGVAFSWIIQHATQRAVLTWAGGRLINATWTTASNAYVGYAGNVAGQASPWTGGNQPEGIWFPSHCLPDEAPTISGPAQVSWFETDAARATSGARGMKRWTLTTRIDNTADDWAEYGQLAYSIVAYWADGRYVCWFGDRYDAFADATLLALDERQEELEFRRLGGGRRFFDVGLFFTEIQGGMQ